MIMNGSPLGTALMNCVVPFLIGDTIKIVLATVIAVPLRSRLNAIMQGNSKSELDK